MAASLVATTLDGAGNPIDFAIQSGGAVVVNQYRATNNATTPYRQSGEQTLAGLSASSIAAVTLPDGDPAVFASTGPESYLYENTYAPTGNAMTPFAWTGWQRMGTFVATSIAAASPTDATAAAQATVFGLGADGIISAAAVTAPGGDPSQAVFTTLTSFDATSFSAKALSSQILVAALAGPQSYGYADLYTPATTLATAGSSAGWTVSGQYVLSSVAASTDASGKPIVAGVTLYHIYQTFSISSDAVSLSLDQGTAPASNPANDQVVNRAGYDNLVGSVFGFASLTLPGSTAVGYFTAISSQDLDNSNHPLDSFFPTDQGVVFLESSVPDDVTGTDDFAVNGQALIIVNLATSTGDSNDFYVSGTDGTIYDSHVTLSTDPANPLTASAYASLGTLPP